MKPRRLFAGVEVAATEELRALVADLRRELDGERIRWVRLENMHLTVEFFGETPEERIPDLEQALAKAAAGAQAFTMKIGGLGLFGGARHPKVIWLGVEPGGLGRLHECVNAGLRERGREPEVREFTPHVTLGRMGWLKNVSRFNGVVETHRNWTAPGQPVTELILFESISGKEGLNYVARARYPLRGE
ncbi:MAG TPA: RNA 2',3'-cyclic phosphodiesterase [Verrucomicrobia bacterium]|nr:RNA 2',3'-cyclic phosphodiesterase [Verrucomicrobiota bacterium]